MLLITADDSYEVFLNGSRIGSGTPTGKLDRYSVTARLARGRNVLAVKVKNSKGKTAGLAGSLEISLNDGKAQRIVTDATWRTYLRPLPLWNTALYNDRRWPTAKRLGARGSSPTLDKARIGRGDVLAGNSNKGRVGGVTRLLSETPPVSLVCEYSKVISSS